MSKTNISSSPSTIALAWHKLGAIAYILWGLWHIPVVIKLWTQGGNSLNLLVLVCDYSKVHFISSFLCYVQSSLERS
ncbi:MAG: hypothetical protein AAGF95_27785 [Chloroflexota bacterium]